jgi:type VI protein secretion system component VasK
MGALKKVFGNWWVLSGLIVLVVLLVLVLLLPLVAPPTRPLWVRATILAVVLLVWGGLAAWRMISARQASDRIAKDLTAGPADAEGAALAARMKTALAGLKTVSGNRRDYLYTRPWYIIIGPPGAGKTTALVNSGLRFPASETAPETASFTFSPGLLAAALKASMRPRRGSRVTPRVRVSSIVLGSAAPMSTPARRLSAPRARGCSCSM